MRVAVLVLLAALAPIAAPAPVHADRIDTGGARTFVRTVLTADGSRYHYQVVDGELRVTAGPATGRDENRREVLVHRDAVASRAQGICATWQAATSQMAQEGLAVRVRHDGPRRRAVTLTKNTIFDLHYVFNILTWDTARRGDPWRAVGQFDMSSALAASPRRLDALPWRVCLRVVGRRVAFLVWPLGRVPRPRWSDPAYARHDRLPRSFVLRGRPGWYVGHIPAHGRIAYRDLRTW